MDRFDDINNNNNPNNSSSLEKLKELERMKKYGNVDEYNVFGKNNDIKDFMKNPNEDENINNNETLEQNNNVENKSDFEQNNESNEEVSDSKGESKEDIKEESEEIGTGKKFENKADEILSKIKNVKVKDLWGKLKGDSEEEEAPEELERLTLSVARVMTVFLTLFILLIGYISYFQIFKAPEIAEKSSNPRISAKRNELLRGNIYDKDGQVIAESERKDKISQKRKYPFNELYAHPIGYIDETRGLTGLESAYDQQLREQNIPFTFEGIIGKLKSIAEPADGPKMGNSVVTTLDTKLQKIAFDALGDNQGSVVVLNPNDGAILASVSKPSYNPNELDAIMTDKSKQIDGMFFNKAVYDPIAPGSTFKTLTLTSAYENISGIESKSFNDIGYLDVGNGAKIDNFEQQPNGPIDIKEGLKRSSNFVFGTVALDLGNDKLKKTAEEFGFNSKIPVDGIPSKEVGESKFPTLESARKGEIAQSGIGQGAVSATPMQMALVASGIANGGVIMQPTLVKEVKNQSGDVVMTIEPKEYKQIKSDVASKTKEAMKATADNYSKGTVPSLAGLNAAGKTGTADYVLANGQLGKANAWFIGFAPADNPQVVVAVQVRQGGLGGKAAAPVGASVMKAALGK